MQALKYKNTTHAQRNLNVVSIAAKEQANQLNLFIAGYGNVGKELVSVIKKYNESSFAHSRRVKIAGVCNSRKMAIYEHGVDATDIPRLLEQGEKSDIGLFFRAAKKLGLKNSVLVDCTASDSVASAYRDFLSGNISVVTCNKIALADSYDNYARVRKSPAKDSSFLYETTVGAALPVISSIRQLLRGGDKIRSIEAILSGTLNYLFSNYDGSVSFAQLLRQAQQLGYTEPNPAIDISGEDVIRKSLILSRECGETIEREEVVLHPLFSQEVLSAKGEALYENLEKEEHRIKKLYDDATADGCRLRYVARISPEGCEVGLKTVGKEHPLYDICDRDNAVIITSRNYSSPLRIIGAGAGAAVTASGLFNDIIHSV